MICRDAEPLLSAFLENDLPAEVRSEVERHLQLCPACSQLKDDLEHLLSRMPELQAEVPFLLKNRLLNIADNEAAVVAPDRFLWLPKWVAATVGTMVLMLNLFYFTNIFPAANRQMHAVVAGIERIVVRTGGWVERVRESKDLLFYTLFSSESADSRANSSQAAVDKLPEKGGRNG